ncbi:peptide chain release factor 1, partial [Wuchereria bancrofti]
MYHNYAQFMKWKWTPYQMDASPSGGIRSAVVFVRGIGVFRTLRYEAGVHRVQRFPVTDKTRMHTSTSVVAVLPEPEKIEACVTPADVKVETMRASGPGGQNVNQRSTAVRLTHRETGVTVHCTDERTQYSNMEIAYKRLAAILLQRKLDETQKQYSSSRKLRNGRGIRSAVVFVRGIGVFRTLRYEAGVHRVQRFPVTDKTRMHTSTSVVAVLPEPEK